MSERKKYDESEWIYATARVRALEKRLPDKAKLERLLEARDKAEVCALLAEYGLKLDPDDTEKGLREFLRSVYRETDEMAADKSLLDVVKLQNDCHNVKSALKCSIVLRDPTHLLSENGTIPPEKTVYAVEERKFDLLPAHMGKAAENALEVWSKTRDPQSIDQLIDDACARDRMDAAKAGGDKFSIGLVENDVDTTNILICLRILRMTGEDADMEYLSRMLLPCGSLSHDFFTTAYNDGEPALWAKLASTRYSDVASEADKHGNYSLSFIEKTVENKRIDYLKNARYVLAGVPALIAYICAAEFYVKDVRIVLSGKEAGTDVETIRERLRGTYV